MREIARLSLPVEPRIPERVERLTFSQDGARLAVVRQQRGTTGRTAIGSVLLFRVADGAAIASLMGETAVFLSPDRLLTSRFRTYGYVLSADTGDELRSIGLGPPAAFAPNHRWIAASAYNGGLALFEHEKVGSAILPLPWRPSDPPLLDVVFSPDELRVVAVYEDGSIRSFHTKKHSVDPLLSAASPRANAHRVAFSPDGALLAVGRRDGCLDLIDVATGAVISRRPSEGPSSLCLAFSPDGARLAVGNDHAAVVLDARTGAQLFKLPGPGESVAFSPDGALLATGGPGAVSLWDLEADGEAVVSMARAEVSPPSLLSPLVACREQEPGGGPGPVQSIAFRPDGAELLSAVGASVILRKASDLSAVHAIDIADSDRVVSRTSRMGEHEVLDLRCALRLVVGFSAGVPVVAEWSTAGLVEGRSDSEVIVRRVSDGSTLARLGGHGAPVRSVVFDPTSDRAITLADQAILWELRSGRAIGQAQAEAAAFHPDGRVALVDQGVVTLWGQSGSKIAEHEAPVSSLLFDATGKLVATHSPGRVLITRIEKSQRLIEFKIAPGRASIAFAHGGIAIADGALRLFRIDDGTLVGSASQQNAARVSVIASSPNGALAWGIEQTSTLCKF